MYRVCTYAFMHGGITKDYKTAACRQLKGGIFVGGKNTACVHQMVTISSRTTGVSLDGGVSMDCRTAACLR